MTAAQAKAKGYKVERASPYEWGLLCNGKGIKTWWARDFCGTPPTLDHPLIQEAININETYGKNPSTTEQENGRDDD